MRRSAVSCCKPCDCASWQTGCSTASTFTAVVDAAPGVADLAFLALIDEIARDKKRHGSYDLVVG